MKKVISLDIGGTNLRCALINEKFEIEKVIIHPTKKGTSEDFLIQVEDIINEIGVTPEVVAISMGVPGRVRWDGYIFELPNVGIKNIPLSEYLNSKFHLTTYIKNDAEMAGLAEGVIGAGKDYNSTLFITISTGFGFALVRNKKLMVPSDEMGHTLINFNGDLYELERLCSGKYIVELCKLNGLFIKDAQEFFKLKEEKNELALKVYDQWLNYLTDIFQFAKKYFEVDIMVFTGGMMKSSQYFFNDLKERNHNIIMTQAMFDQNAGLIGSCYYALFPN